MTPSSDNGDRDLVERRHAWSEPARSENGRTSERPFVSVIVPAYNEAAIIGQTLQTLRSYMISLEPDYRWEIVVVNDGSSDDTGRIATEIAQRWTEVRVLHHRTNFNLGQALRYAFSTCRGDYVVTLDSDLSYAPEHIGRLLDAIRTTHAKIVIASPYLRGGHTTGVPVVRMILSRAANGFLWLSTKRQLATLTSMVRVYDRPFLTSLDLSSVDVGINTEIVYKAQVLKAKIGEIPAHLDWSRQLEAGPDRRSSLRLTRSVAAYVSSGFLFRPLAFFAIPGLALLGLALLALGVSAYRVLDRMITADGSAGADALTAAFAAAPVAFVVGIVALVLGVQLLSVGVVVAQNKAYFEGIFHLGTTTYRRMRSDTGSSGMSPPECRCVLHVSSSDAVRCRGAHR